MISIMLECDKCHSKLTLEGTTILKLNKNNCDGWFIDIDETSDTASCYCPKCYQEVNLERYQRTMWLAGLD